jgi:hypothetical protein
MLLAVWEYVDVATILSCRLVWGLRSPVVVWVPLALVTVMTPVVVLNPEMM